MEDEGAYGEIDDELFATEQLATSASRTDRTDELSPRMR